MSRPPKYYLSSIVFCLLSSTSFPPSNSTTINLVPLFPRRHHPHHQNSPPLPSFSSVSQLINFIYRNYLNFSTSQLSHLSQLHLYQLHLSQLSQLLNCLIYLNFIFTIAPSNLTIIIISISSAPNYISLFITSLSLKGSPPALQLNPCRHQQVIPIPTVSPILLTDIPYLSSS